MRTLLACTCLTPIALIALSGPAAAETVIKDKRTSAVRTATVKNGAADDATIDSAGSVVLSSGTAVTLDSDNDVVNKGTIQITGANDATGILAEAGRNGSITNSGKITIDEDYTAKDDDKDGDIDGPFAKGARRYGIRVAPGGTFTGPIKNSGTITIEGNQSAGIAVDSRLAGSLSNSGDIAVTGDDSYGIHAQDVTGDVTLNGSIAAKGKNAVGVALDGDIGGALVVQGGIGATGYRSTEAPSDVSKLDADDLLQGGPALRIAGNVAGGIILAAPPADNDEDEDDEDDDGTPDAQEGTANIASYGAAPAVVIGSATDDISVGAVKGASSGYGLIIDGKISGAGVYKGVDGNGLVIGGQGGDVAIAKGMAISGSVAASSLDSNATAIRVGSGASVPAITNSGAITAQGGNLANRKATAVAIDAGANVTSFTNSGAIGAKAFHSDAYATAILDQAGTLTSISNSGVISATGAKDGNNIAIDLRANGHDITLTQTLRDEDASAPGIAGDILFGSGDDSLTASAGTIMGKTDFGAGTNRLTLSGDAGYQGNVRFATAGNLVALSDEATMAGEVDFADLANRMTLADDAVFSGTLAHSGGLALEVGSGRFLTSQTGTIALSSLSVGAEGAIQVNIDGAEGTHSFYDIAGDASFAEGSKVLVNLGSVADMEGDYIVLHAGSLSGAPALSADDTLLPYLFKGALSTDAQAHEVTLSISRKTAQELGLNGSESRAYDAIYNALDNDADVAGTFLSIRDGDAFRGTLRQMLPDHAGGTFETVTQGSRATARFLADPNPPVVDRGTWGFWLQQAAWGTSKGLGDTASYDINGWGGAGGAEINIGDFGHIGGSLAYLYGKNADGRTENEVTASQYEAALYWRANWGGLQANARASAAQIDFSGSRRFTGSAGGTEISRAADANWDGKLYSASGGISYEARMGRFTLRPIAAIDYYRLTEDGYTETGGGEAFDLTVDKRKSDQLAVTGSIAAGYDFTGSDPANGWFRAEIEGGRRQIVGGKLGATTARFADGEDFTLLPTQNDDGWVGKLRLMGGTSGFRLAGEFNAEEQQGHTAIAVRASLGVGF